MKVWDLISTAKDSFSKFRMAQIESPRLTKLSKHCSGRAHFFLHPTLYRDVNLTFPTNIGGIVKDGRITSDMGPGSLENG